MELSSKSRLVRFAYWHSTHLDRRSLPTHTTLCAFFWRAFIFVPIGWGSILTLFSILAYRAYEHPLKALAIVGILVGFTGIVTLIVMFEDLKRENKLDSIKNSTFYQGAKSIKSKFCPIIYIK